jgi:hypothetical protein
MNAISIGVRTCERECALHYALGQWTELNVFCSDGAVSIDNNVSEREMKRVVLNRNYVQFRIMRSAPASRVGSGLFKGQDKIGSAEELSIISVIFWGRSLSHRRSSWTKRSLHIHRCLVLQL